MGRKKPATAGLPDVLRDLELLLRSRYGLVHLPTQDEGRVLSLLRHLTADLDMPLFRWSRLHGLALDGGDGPVYGTRDLGAAFGHIAASGQPALYSFRGIGSDSAKDALLADQLREAVRSLEKIGGAIVVYSVSFIDAIGIDDPVGAFSVHGAGGMWGTLAVGLFNVDKGLFTGHGFGQLGLQLLGIAAYAIFTIVTSWILWSILGALTGGIRVHEKEEMDGLDISEHGMEAYGGFQIWTTQ